MIRISFSTICLFAISSLCLAADEKKPADTPKVNFEEHVLPIFRQHCLKCHNANDAKGGLAIDSYAALMEGGGSGEIVYDGDAEGSRLYQVMTHDDTPVMPPNQDPLPKEKLDVIKNWIMGGLLESSSSRAKKKKGPSLSFTALDAGAKPAEIAMPESVWRVPVTVLPRAAASSAVATSPWAPLVAIGGQKQVALYNTTTAELVGILPYPEGVPQVIQFSLDGAYLVVAGGTHAALGRASVYNVKTGERVTTVGNEFDSIFGADINDYMDRIAIGGPQKLVRIYDTNSGDVVFEMKKHTDWVYCVDYSPDGVLVASGDRSGGLHVWEADTGRLYLNLVGHKGAVRGVSWRGDSNVLVSASEDGTVKVWEMTAGKQLKSFNAHGGGVTSVMMAKDGRIVTSGKDRTVKLWQADGKLVQAYPAFAEAALEAAISSDGTRIIGGDWSGRTVMWHSDDPKKSYELAANPPTLSEQQAALTARIAELEKAAAAAATAQANSKKAHDSAVASHGSMQAKLAEANKLLAEANGLKASSEKAIAQLTPQKNQQDKELAAINAQVSQLAAQVNTATTKSSTAGGLVTTIDSLAGVRAEKTKIANETTAKASELSSRELEVSAKEKVALANKAKQKQSERHWSRNFSSLGSRFRSSMQT